MEKFLLMAALIALSACRRSDVPAPPAPAATVKSHAAGVAAAQVIAPAEAAASRLALDSEGLRLFNAVSGASRLVPFGTTRPDALRVIGAALKLPQHSQGNNADCGASYVSWDNGLTVWFAKDRLVGWSALPSAAPLGTASGVKPGSSRAELERAYAVKIAPSSLGTEFAAGALAGLLTSDGADAKVMRMWAGVVCPAR